MPKRPGESDSEHKWRKKIRRYEKKLARCAQPQVQAEVHAPTSKMAAPMPDEAPPPPPAQPSGQDEDIIEQSENYNYSDQQEPTLQEEGELNHGNYPEHNECDENMNSQIPALAGSLSPGSSSDSSSSSEAVTKEGEAIDPKLLEALGDCHTDTPEWGDEILQDIAQRWEPIFRTGLKKDVKEDLYKKYLFPKNIPLSKPPILNPEIAAVLTEQSKNRDSRVSTKQNQIGRTLAAIGRAMSGIINKSMETSDVIRTLNDAGKLLSDSHYLETDTRRSLVTPLLDKAYIMPFKDRKRDSFLFGDNLGDFIKSSRGIKKTGQMITPPVPSTSNLNYNKAPQRQQRNVRVQQPSRGGGSQRPPPPTVRRSAPPPPPPAHAPRYSAPRPPPPHSYGNRRPQNASSRSRNAT
ncbi:hypothetical protein O0L34_g14010 [Tuta absoluta]|nr:hypothetical protein O0L34_g14010 [Tuta absoluta]